MSRTHRCMTVVGEMLAVSTHSRQAIQMCHWYTSQVSSRIEAQQHLLHLPRSMSPVTVSRHRMQRRRQRVAQAVCRATAEVASATDSHRNQSEARVTTNVKSLSRLSIGRCDRTVPDVCAPRKNPEVENHNLKLVSFISSDGSWSSLLLWIPNRNQRSQAKTLFRSRVADILPA